MIQTCNMKFPCLQCQTGWFCSNKQHLKKLQIYRSTHKAKMNNFNNIHNNKLIQPFGVVYLLKNSINNQVYIGSTSRNIKARFAFHKSRGVIKKSVVPENNWSVSVLMDNVNLDELKEMEQIKFNEYLNDDEYELLNHNKPLKCVLLY